MENELLVLIQSTDPSLIEDIARAARNINIAAPDINAVKYLQESVSTILGRNVIAGSPEFNQILGVCRELAEFRENLFLIRTHPVLPSQTSKKLSFDEEPEAAIPPSKKRKSTVNYVQ